MNFIYILAIGVAVSCVAVSAEECFDQNEACHSTDYHSYVDCVRKRHKRSTDCDLCSSGNCINTCNSCDCDSCNYNNCGNSCNSCCNTCCSNYIPCRTNHCCHRTCQTQCENSKCRSTCRKNCFENVRKYSEPVYIPQSSGGSPQALVQNSSISNNGRHNVTTIIHLNNVINNTNIIDVPININNTNDQNITLYTADGTPAGQKEQCCTVIGPRQCVSYPTPKCFHYRSKQCGAYCTSNIVHREEKQICESYYPGAPVNCRQQVYYIPQPTPRCSYQSTWPYVSCSIQPTQVGCEGCYSHYVDQSSNNYLQCSSQCYDQGYQTGPLYRQGPIYRPTYYHAPCNGCYGFPQPYNEMNYGYAPYPQIYQQSYPQYHQNYGSYVPVGPYPINYPQLPEQVIPLNDTAGISLLQNSTAISGLPVSNNEFPVQIQMDVDTYPQSQAQVRIRNPEKFKRDETAFKEQSGTGESDSASTSKSS